MDRVLSVRSMCSMLVLGISVSGYFSRVGSGLIFYTSNSFCLRIMYAMCPLAICEKDFVSLWILELEICGHGGA